MKTQTKHRSPTLLALVLSLCMLLSAVVICTVAAEASTWDGAAVSTTLSGTGTEEDPYLIQSAADLKYLADKVNDGTLVSAGKYFKQTVDIDLANKPWTPIGLTDTNFFSGIYDGGLHTISNMTVTEASLTVGETTYFNRAGLFGFIGDNGSSMTQIKNLAVKGTIAGDSITKAGAIVATAYQTKLDNLYTDVDITLKGALSQHGAGIVAEALAESNVSYCVAEGDITLTEGGAALYIGGIVGNAKIQDQALYMGSTRSIDNCYYTGTITIACNGNVNTIRAGGIAGGFMNGAMISNTFMFGTVSYTNAAAEQTLPRVGLFVGGYGYSQSNALFPSSVISNSFCLVPADSTLQMIGNTSNSSTDGCLSITAEQVPAIPYATGTFLVDPYKVEETTPEVTTPEETTPEVTTPEETTPEETTTADKATDTKPANNSNESGCASVATGAAIAMIMMTATACVMVSKKKK